MDFTEEQKDRIQELIGINTSDGVTISRKRYERLLESEAQLFHLESLGVDNWEGYSWYKQDDEEDDE